MTSSFDTLEGDDSPGKAQKDDAKAALESQLQEEKDAHNEERFVWIVVCVILVDVLWFRNAPNATAPVVVMVLELVVLLVLAKRMGIPELVSIFERIINGVSRR